MRDVLAARGAPLLGAYVVPEAGDRESAARAAAAVRAAGADLVATATSGPERSRWTSTNQSIDLAATCQDRAGTPALATVTTWSRTVMSLQAHLLGAHARGVTRLICGNGMPPPPEERAWIDGRWAVDAVGLIELLRGLNEGVDRYGLRLDAATHFDIGVRIRAVPVLSAADRARTRRKISAGADFIVTSPVYTPHALDALLDVVDGAVPVLATVHPLRSSAEAELLRRELPDGCMPTEWVERLDRAGDRAAEEGERIAVELASRLAESTQGIMLSRADRPEVVSRVRAVLMRPVVG
ncbi:methylenetetrahydrofolate reductase [Streptomyces cylindrosporus]|uniref:Methylenetetrahydrofolate reductase n=1 Tax=Streptomyces cylindrosporus TaxID=2927583 RepID=A0ABS9YHS0_9ACTN|nr:methylenetetrahydrofolate reductase [Streptomyces cylindrosporus]MCI3276800.1 methylenetetrahydrofolate reductase [Streptomyces cylindrosporus]